MTAAPPPFKISEIDFFAGGWGTVEDQTIEVSRETYDRVKAWLETLDDVVLRQVHVQKNKIRAISSNDDRLKIDLESEAKIQRTIGGNTWNVWANIIKILQVVDPSLIGKFPLHTLDTPLIHYALSTLGPVDNAKIHYSETEAKGRTNYLLVTAGEDPIYLRTAPDPAESGKLPNVQNLFVSSLGRDANTTLRTYLADPPHRLYLSPGSAQVQRGIPKDILAATYLLACNRDEVTKIAKATDKKFPKNPRSDDIETFLKNLPITEARITDGANGIYVMHEGIFSHYPAPDRDEQKIQSSVSQLGFTGNNGNFNGCGDLRLAAEIAAKALGIPLPDSVNISQRLAAVHSFSATSNLAAYPKIGEDIIQRTFNSTLSQ